MPYLTHDPIDASHWHRQAPEAKDGASLEFTGIVRGDDGGTRVEGLQYEAYEPMAERLIAQYVELAQVRWSLHHVSLTHRVGQVPAGELAVLIKVSAPHRDQAFEACRFLIEAIKHEVPIWKRAQYDDGTSQWITGTPELLEVADPRGADHAHV